MIEIKTNVGYAGGLYDHCRLITNLCLSGFKVSSYIYNEVSVVENKFTKNTVMFVSNTVAKINGKVENISCKYYSQNCALIFLDDTSMDEETFNFFIGSAGYTFVFTNWNLFSNSIKLYDNLYLYHIKSKIKYTRKSINIDNISKLNFENSIYVNGLIKHDASITDQFIFSNKPFYNLKLEFLFGINYITFYNYYEKSFLVYIPEFSYNVEKYYNVVYDARANRTNNILCIAISKDAK